VSSGGAHGTIAGLVVAVPDGQAEGHAPRGASRPRQRRGAVAAALGGRAASGVGKASAAGG